MSALCRRASRRLPRRSVRLPGIAAVYAVAAGVLVTAGAGMASAQTSSIASILGQAGPDSTASPLPLVSLVSGVNCENATINGNAGLAAGTFTSAATCHWQNPGHIYAHSSVTNASSLSLITNDDLTSQMKADALNANDYFAGLEPTQTIDNGQITGNLTLEPEVPAGFNVVDVNSISLPAGTTLTFTGPPGTQWVINDSGNFENSGAAIVLGGGVTPSDVVFNLTNPAATVYAAAAAAGESGIILAPHNLIAADGSTWTGAIIAAGITLRSGIALFPAAAVVPTPTVGILVQSATSTSTSNRVPHGESVHGAAWVINATIPNRGTVEFRYYSGETALADCMTATTAFRAGQAPSGGTYVSTESVPASSSVISEDVPATALAVGTYYWAAFSVGYPPPYAPRAASPCAPLIVEPSR